MPKGSDNHSKVEDGAIEIALIDNYIAKINNELSEMWSEVMIVLKEYEKSIGDDVFAQRDVVILRARYEERRTIEEIADYMDLTPRRVLQILKKTERKIEMLS